MSSLCASGVGSARAQPFTPVTVVAPRSNASFLARKAVLLPLTSSREYGVRREARCAAAAAAPADNATAKDTWIPATLKAIEPASSGKLGDLQASAREALTASRMPTTRDEEFKYTDISALLGASLKAPKDVAVDPEMLEELTFPEASDSLLVLVDGRLDLSASRLSGIPDGIYLGTLADAPEWAASKLGVQSSSRGDVFASLNSAIATDVIVLAVPEGTQVSVPIHILALSSSASADGELNASAPRLLVSLGKDAAAEIVEEYQSLGEGNSFCTSVAEIELEEGASLKHGLLQLSNPKAGTHVKATLVTQAANSSYKLVESRLGGLLTRHDVSIEQLGPDTNTTMRHFLLCGDKQLHDLHTKLVLDHPRGIADQIHKCIAATSSSRGVFDGNVQVKRLAQQSDAGQLSRNLLLAPRATVNVKPNLQIVADDVKCTHGCAVSDLSDEELFYFASRGINKDTARDCLVYSFGAEVLNEHGHKALSKRVEAQMKAMLK